MHAEPDPFVSCPDARRAALSSVDPGFRAAVISGLSAPQKSLPSKYLYDERGSLLFEAICKVSEYYPARTETALLAALKSELSAAIPVNSVLVEYGSGASVKTRILLDAAPQLSGYVPIDISAECLAEAVETIRRDYPGLAISPLRGDFTKPLKLPRLALTRPRVGFFPGSTIGNFSPSQSVAFLDRARRTLGSGARFVVGADLIKDASVQIPAYDDAAGVTAAFNLNLLTRINRELNGDANLDGFTHSARWNKGFNRMEMHLVSLSAQSFRAAGRVFSFAAGETIHTENAYKFTPRRLGMIAEQSGWRMVQCWVSAAPQFAVALLESP